VGLDEKRDECPNGHGHLSRIKEPIDVELLVPEEVLDFLMERQENRVWSSEAKAWVKSPPVVFSKIAGVCLECGYVEAVEG